MSVLLVVLGVICSVRAGPDTTEEGAAIVAVSVVVAGLCLLAALAPLGGQACARGGVGFWCGYWTGRDRAADDETDRLEAER